MSSVTAVMCTIGRPEALARTLPALARACALLPGAEVLVVDQSAGGMGALVADHGFTHVVDTRVGVSRARNLAMRRANHEIVAFTDDDCVVPERWLLDHVAVLRDLSLAGSFGSVRGLPRGEADDTDPTAEQRVRTSGEPPWDVGHSSNMALRRTAMERVGGFDERIGPGADGVQAGEDADLIVRLLRNGARLASGTGEPVQHLHWRTDALDDEVLRSYEAGAGVWIGSAIRARDRHAVHHLRNRLAMVSGRSRSLLRQGRRRQAIGMPLALASGLARGLLLSPWAGTGDQGASDSP